MPITLISLNIEGKLHLKNRILPFLKRNNPDVICLQEVFRSDVKSIETSLGMTGVFVPLATMSYRKHIRHPRNALWGILIASRFPTTTSGYSYYCGSQLKMPVFYPGLNPNVINRAVAWIQITNRGEAYTVATTHFTWAYNGGVTDLQKQTFTSLLKILDCFPEIILTGDFNTPRGGEIFAALGRRYADNIPRRAETTIDNTLHRSGDTIRLVVDGLFTSPLYRASGVKLVGGISDHLAIVSTISRQPRPARLRSGLKLLQNRTVYAVWWFLYRAVRKPFRLAKQLLVSSAQRRG